MYHVSEFSNWQFIIADAAGLGNTKMCEYDFIYV